MWTEQRQNNVENKLKLAALTKLEKMSPLAKQTKVDKA